ncbi:MAG: AIR synthase-related protein [Planctomycetota bacterium]
MGEIYTVTVSGEGDPHLGDDPELRAALLGIEDLPVERALADAVYFLELAGGVGHARLEGFARRFLAGDPSRVARVETGLTLPERPRGEASIVLLRRPGVMDPVEGSVLHALRDAGIAAAGARVRTARRYRLAAPEGTSSPSRDLLDGIAAGRLGNALVDEWRCFLAGEEERLPDPFRGFSAAVEGRREVPILGRQDEILLRISELGGLSLSLAEMKAIEEHFRGLGREPTDLELEMIAQTWSEHCCHKTLTGPIEYGEERIDSLLSETIFAVTRELDPPYCWSVFRDNAGVIAIDDEWGLTFKVETHNHPSALEPYGGAGTGIGGVIRDTLGTGLGARPVLSTDIFCFGPLEITPEQIPAGTLHPVRLLRGVVAGVRDYGNRMGIPTANGAIIFHPGYTANPLVFCGSVGLIPRGMVEKEVEGGDLIVAIGGRTGRDGIHGATFSSRELTEDSEHLSAGAVQIGNPIEEKKLQDALLRARDEGLYRAVTDCGAGGFSSAVGEMGKEIGAEVELDAAPLKYEGLGAGEIWISESQERMVLAVPPCRRKRLFEILDEEEVEGCVLGAFGAQGILRVRHQNEVVGELETSFLFDGRPRAVRQARRPAPAPEVALEFAGDGPGEILRRLLSHPNIASKEAVIRQYDHEVQGRMVVRPLTGARADAPSDGCAFDPLRDGRFTVVVGCGILPLLGEVDAHEMGAQAVDEALRNVIATGGGLERVALLDNFAWGDVSDPDILGALIECARGAAGAARAYRAPFISGKDSLHNVYRAGGVARSIPGTLLVSAASVVPGSPRAPTTDLKRSGSVLLLAGPTPAGIPGSLLQLICGGAGGEPARFDGILGRALLERLEEWIARGALLACHDLSEGGLAVAAAEMALGGSAEGLLLDLDAIPGADAHGDADLLFGEGPHRFLLEVEPEIEPVLLEEAGEIPVARVGRVTGDARLVARRRGRTLIDAPLSELGRLFRAPLEKVWPVER